MQNLCKREVNAPNVLQKQLFLSGIFVTRHDFVAFNEILQNIIGSSLNNLSYDRNFVTLTSITAMISIPHFCTDPNINIELTRTGHSPYNRKCV